MTVQYVKHYKYFTSTIAVVRGSISSNWQYRQDQAASIMLGSK